MVRNRPWVDKRSAFMSWEEAVYLTALGGKPRPMQPARPTDGQPATVVSRVLCWWCREMHSPAEVEICMALPRKTAAANGSASSTSKPLAAGLLKQYSELWEFLTAETYPDGTKRRTGRISVSFESGLLGLLLTDEETGQYAFLNGRDLDDLLADGELRLADGSLSWRPSRYQQRKKN